MSAHHILGSVLPVTPYSKANLTGSGLFIPVFVPTTELQNHQPHPRLGTQICLHLKKRLFCFCHGDQSEGETLHGEQESMVSGHLRAPAFLGRLWKQKRFFFQSLVELHMVEIKGVTGCMVLLYFQALLLIRKQDQRQY